MRNKVNKHACAPVVFPVVIWHKTVFRATYVWADQMAPPSPSTFVWTRVCAGLGSHEPKPTRCTVAGESDCSPSAHEFRAPAPRDLFLYRRGVERIHQGRPQGPSGIPKLEFVLWQLIYDSFSPSNPEQAIIGFKTAPANLKTPTDTLHVPNKTETVFIAHCGKPGAQRSPHYSCARRRNCWRANLSETLLGLECPSREHIAVGENGKIKKATNGFLIQFIVCSNIYRAQQDN